MPRSLLHNLSHNKVLHERVVFLTIDVEEVPTVPREERVSIEELGDGCWRVHLRFGFMERTDVPEALQLCASRGLEFNMMETSFFLSREKIISTAGKAWRSGASTSSAPWCAMPAAPWITSTCRRTA